MGDSFGYQQKMTYAFQLARKRIASWWFQPIWKNMCQNYSNFPRVSGWTLRNIWNHHLDCELVPFSSVLCNKKLDRNPWVPQMNQLRDPDPTRPRNPNHRTVRLPENPRAPLGVSIAWPGCFLWVWTQAIQKGTRRCWKVYVIEVQNPEMFGCNQTIPKIRCSSRK